jgi:hypothetical protein
MKHFNAIEPRLFSLNDVKHRLAPEVSYAFEKSRQRYVSIRVRYDDIMVAD